jgi:hypothetical protein
VDRQLTEELVVITARPELRIRGRSRARIPAPARQNG